jgi:choline dehydrogenase-like flavoprotein
MGAMIDDGSSSRGYVKRVLGKTLMFYNLAPADLLKMKQLDMAILKVWAQSPAVQYLRLNMWPFFPSNISDSRLKLLGYFIKDEIGAFEKWFLANNVALPIFAFHPLGTCVGIIDDSTTGRARGISNLHIVDGSGIQGPLGTNPMVTIGAKAYNIGEKILL